MMNATATAKKINNWKIARYVTPLYENGKLVEGGKTVVNFYSSLDEIEICHYDENGDIINPAQFVPINDVPSWNVLVEAYDKHAAANTFQRYILA